jgi:Rps23 Pro-64 3,4-dihydroxylase Tpa1-like proline 4-hydroxylase
MQTTNRTAFAALPPHLVIDSAFGADLADRLLAFAIAREADFLDTSVGRNKTESGNGLINKAIRSSRAIRDFGSLRPELEAAFHAVLPHAVSQLGLAEDPPDRLALELAAHGDGDFYRRHIDTFVGNSKPKSNRALTGVYYVHSTPRAFSGGALRLHSILPVEQGGASIDIEPVHDRLLLFPAWVPHEVCTVTCPGGDFADARFAINCWYLREAPDPTGPERKI